MNLDRRITKLTEKVVSALMDSVALPATVRIEAREESSSDML